MMLWPSRLIAILVAIIGAACSAGDNSVDPGDLELRDLLGISPEIASAWTDAQRAAARHVLTTGLRETEPAVELAVDPAATPVGEQLPALLAAGDAQRTHDGADALGVVRIAPAARQLEITPRDAPATAALLAAPGATVASSTGAAVTGAAATTVGDPATHGSTAGAMIGAAAATVSTTGAAAATVGDPATHGSTAGASANNASAASVDPSRGSAAIELRMAPAWSEARAWSHLAARGSAAFASLAADAGHPGGPLVVVPAPQLAVIAAYLPAAAPGATPTLTVNPVLIAAIEPTTDEAAHLAWTAPADPAGGAQAPPPPLAGPAPIAATGGNPYSFYGSVEECAFAQRTRCDGCLAGSRCTPITDAADAATECTMLAANSGRGYFLLCINLALAITSVEGCTGDAAPTCVRDPHAADSLTTLENNATFLAEPTCAGALDDCLAKIYGAPRDPFPGLDGGTTSPTPPRSTSVNCGDSCDSKSNNNCNASPSCQCTGPSCNNSLSCDSACSSSNNQSGCGGNCNACTSSDGGGGGGGGGCSSGSSSSGGSCSSDSGSGGSSCSGSGSSNNSSCGSCGSSNSSGSCSGSSSNSSSSCGSGCGGSSGSCGGSGGCGSSSSGGCSGGGSGKCNVASSDPGPAVAIALSLLWAFLPVPVATLTRRRLRRRRPDPTKEEP